MDTVWTYLERVAGYDQWVVVIQLLMIIVVVWLVMRFLRGTRGARLVKGAAVLMAIVFVAFRLLPSSGEWRRIEFLYSYFMLFAFVAFVVAFQPEFRRALISIGQARLFHSQQTQTEHLVEELMGSVAYLSRNKIGAIVALERAVGLGAISETGTPIFAQVSAELLNTIFYPGSMLHDMGVIIHENQIIAAGCQFPLAESDEVDPSLGSRHRAALGLAKDSDAVVLVVSEETGRISLAYDGQLMVGLDRQAVQDILMSLLETRRPLIKTKGGAS